MRRPLPESSKMKTPYLYQPFSTINLIWKTTNFGQSWISIPNTDNYLSIKIVDNLNWFAVESDNGLYYKTVDGGQNWIKSSSVNFDFSISTL